jgi:uncharacterized protein YacL
MTASSSASGLLPLSSFFTRIRLLYLILCMIAGIYAGLIHSPLPWPDHIPKLILWGTGGVAIACTALWLEIQLLSWPRAILIGGSLGLIVGIAGTGLFLLGIGLSLPRFSSLTPWIMLPAFLLCPYIGMVTGMHIAKSLWPATHRESPQDSGSPLRPPTSLTSQKLLDSSAIIDGRILALCTTGFLDGPLVVPQCILHELQTLADSGLPSKRTRGRRGLDILSQLQQLPNLEVRVIDDCEPTLSAVDHQLIAIAKKHHGKIVTNDWNLSRIASLQGVLSLNVNELTYELRPLVLPGETIRVFIHKEGQGQGIAHLDDGTMVVIDHGASLLGQAVDVVVTRFMQTNTGRMIFTSLAEAPLIVSST